MSIPMSYPNGPGLGLHEFSTSYIAAFHEYTSDPEVIRWPTWGTDTLEQARTFVEAAAQAHLEAERSAYLLAAMLEDRAIGSVPMWTTGLHDSNTELGYTFHRAHWGNDYATEAVSRLLALGFNTLQPERISSRQWGIEPRPPKTSSTREDLLRSHREVNGTRRDSLLFYISWEEHVES